MKNTSRIVRTFLGLTLAGLSYRFAAHAQTAPPRTYDFVVDSTWDHTAQGAMPASPQDQPPESAWRPASGPRYTLSLGSGGQRIELHAGSSTYSGHLVSQGADGRRYVLDRGTFAGGRFVLRADGAHGELLVYGSGVPLIRGEHGTLVSP